MNEKFFGLKALFAKNRLPTVVSDSTHVLKRFEECGFDTASVDDISAGDIEAPVDVLLIPAIPSIHPNQKLLNSLKKSAVLLVPLLAFSYGKKEVDYLVKRLSTLSFADACEKNLELVEYIQHIDRPITINSAGCSLTLEIGADVDIMIPKVKADIKPGEWISIIQYLEIGMVPNSHDNSFLINGTLLCEGVTIAHHLHSHFQSGPPAYEAWKILDNLRTAGRFPLILDIKNSELYSLRTCDGAEILGEILPLTDEIKRGGLTEAAFGALPATTFTDWTINSQLNEPIGGFHVGIGAGESAAHIDFVSPKASWT